MKSSCALALVLALSACASVPEQANETTERNRQLIEKMMTASCCTPLSQLSFVPLLKGQSPIFKIDETSPLIRVPGGRSYAAGIEVPAHSSPIYLVVRGFGVGIYAPSSSNFQPAFIPLDEEGIPMEPLTYSIRAARADWTNRPSLEATIELRPSSKPLRIVIYTDPATLNRRTPVIVDNGTYLVPNGPFGSFRAYLP